MFYEGFGKGGFENEEREFGWCAQAGEGERDGSVCGGGEEEEAGLLCEYGLRDPDPPPLREEMPDLFYRKLSFDIYRDDIIFKDPINAFAGIDNYKSILWSLRFHGRIFFRALWIDFVSIWQPTENTVMVCWAIHGIPRTPWESQSRFDATSEYKLDRDGKIYEHKVRKIALNGPQNFQILAVEQLLQSIIYTPTQNH